MRPSQPSEEAKMTMSVSQINALSRQECRIAGWDWRRLRLQERRHLVVITRRGPKQQGISRLARIDQRRPFYRRQNRRNSPPIAASCAGARRGIARGCRRREPCCVRLGQAGVRSNRDETAFRLGGWMQPRGSHGQWRGRENRSAIHRERHGVVRHEAFGARRRK